MTNELLKHSLDDLFRYVDVNFMAKEGSQPEFERLLAQVIGAAEKLSQPVQPKEKP